MNLSNKKTIGAIMLIFGILIIVLTITFKVQKDAMVHAVSSNTQSCFLNDGTCLHTDFSDSPLYFGFSLATAVIAYGVFLLASRESENDHKRVKRKSDSKMIKELPEEEQKVMNLLHKNEGSIFQSDIVKELNITKVKATRLLDRLEGKGLIERKRRGMTNVVLLK